MEISRPLLEVPKVETDDELVVQVGVATVPPLPMVYGESRVTVAAPARLFGGAGMAESMTLALLWLTDEGLVVVPVVEFKW